MNRKSQRGIALVITLIMLSVVTFMAILFLAVTRRERGSVSLSADTVNAQLMADAARARAQAQVMARMLASTNMFDYDLLVSTNYTQPRGFAHQKTAFPNPLNVSYAYSDGRPIWGDDLLQNLANLQYDPRPPVFIPKSDFNTNTDFRFYIDFNRNGRFETNGPQPIISGSGLFLDTNGNPTATLGNILSNNYVGDPEWIGVLEHPERPHSETNRFIGRYAFMVLPAGKSLDLNFIHNQANATASDALPAGNNGYFRNQGVGSWELNLAGFLRDLNTNALNAWPRLAYQNYNPLGTTRPTGVAFDDARGLLAYRYANTRNTLKPMSQVFLTKNVNFLKDMVDHYSDGPIDLINFPAIIDNDPIKRPWPGGENTNAFQDVQELFTVGRGNPALVAFTNRLTAPMILGRSSYDRYMFYRLLGQMGVDSAPALKNKININYEVERGKTSTNITHWVPSHFFLTTADAMLKASMFTNVTTFGGITNTNYFIGSTLVRPTISITNIQLYFDPTKPRPIGYINPGNEYTAAIHRILQLAANIYDATTNAGASYPYYPSVFRPMFTKTSSNIFISGFVEEQNSDFLKNNWQNIQDFANNTAVGSYPAINLYGQALVIGAKKGFPNFNEFTMQTAVQVSRKLEVLKPAATAQFPVRTNQMYLLGITNLFGMEAWNSYTQTFNRSFQIYATNQYSLVLSNVYAGQTNRIRANFGTFGTNISGTSWTGNTTAAANNQAPLASFRLPLNASVMLLTNLPYLPSFHIPLRSWFAPNSLTNIFEQGFDPPEWQLYMTNRITYIMVDSVNRRVVDYVSLDGLTNFMNISQLLAGGTNSAQELVAGSGVNPGSLWDTNRVGGLNGPTVGEWTQLRISLGDITVSPSFWNSFQGATPAGFDKDHSIELFRRFVGTNQLNRSVVIPNEPPSYAHQAPFTPTRRIYKKYSWQANDPLVHYMPEDLTDPILNDPTKTNNVSYLTPNSKSLPPSNLGMINERYRPWGTPSKDNVNDPTAYSTALKDPLVSRSDDWDFPQNPLTTNTIKFPNIGWLGRVHRGTPWQTVYLKSRPATNWFQWSGSFGTDPTNDWKFMDLFTTALNGNSAQGLLSVNQTNVAAWSAVLSGVAVASNTLPDVVVGLHVPPRYSDMFIDPASPQLQQIVNGINATRARQTNGWNTGVFTNMGSILATPELTDRSPFLNTNAVQQQFAISDAVYERIPRQILSLIKEDEPRVVIYSFGQSLKPAPRSLVTDASYYGLCTNYQITGETMTKTVLRFEGELLNPNNPLRTVVESHTVLPPDN